MLLNILLSSIPLVAYPDMPLYKLPQDNGAACLDWTPPAYWFLNASSKASSTKYYINFEVSAIVVVVSVVVGGRVAGVHTVNRTCYPRR